jgi:hypothetical protein
LEGTRTDSERMGSVGVPPREGSPSLPFPTGFRFRQRIQPPVSGSFRSGPSGRRRGGFRPSQGVAAGRIRRLGDAWCRTPDGEMLHPRGALQTAGVTSGFTKSGYGLETQVITGVIIVPIRIVCRCKRKSACCVLPGGTKGSGAQIGDVETRRGEMDEGIRPFGRKVSPSLFRLSACGGIRCGGLRVGLDRVGP